MKRAFIYLPVIVLLTALDQWIKHWAVVNRAALLAGERPGLYIPGVLGLTYAENDGAAFGLMGGGRWFFLGVTVVVLAACVIAFVKNWFPTRFSEAAAAVIVAGALGNMIDRVRQGYVVDYMQFLFVEFAIFNLADALLVCGGIVLLVYFLVFFREPDKEPVRSGELAGNAGTDSGDIPPGGGDEPLEDGGSDHPKEL